MVCQTKFMVFLKSRKSTWVFGQVSCQWNISHSVELTLLLGFWPRLPTTDTNLGTTIVESPKLSAKSLPVRHDLPICEGDPFNSTSNLTHLHMEPNASFGPEESSLKDGAYFLADVMAICKVTIMTE